MLYAERQSKQGTKKLKLLQANMQSGTQICESYGSEMRMRFPMSENVFTSIPHNLHDKINGICYD
jgi:hypothetical protein